MIVGRPADCLHGLARNTPGSTWQKGRETPERIKEQA
jgi:hypothetical protein